MSVTTKYLEFNYSSLGKVDNRLNVTGYCRDNPFKLKYQKRINKLEPRSKEVEQALESIRELDSAVAGLLVEYLFEAALIKTFNIEPKSVVIIGDCSCVSDIAKAFDYDERELIFAVMDGNDLDELAYAFMHAIIHIHGFTRDCPKIYRWLTEYRLEQLKILFKYFVDELIPQLEIKSTISLEPAYFTPRESYHLRSGPDLIIDDKIVDIKCCKTNTLLAWARQLYLYKYGYEWNKETCQGTYVLNIYLNQLIEFYNFEE